MGSNPNRNNVSSPGPYKGREVLKVLSAVIGEKASDTGYVCVMEDGEKEFIPARHFSKES